MYFLSKVQLGNHVPEIAHMFNPNIKGSIFELEENCYAYVDPTPCFVIPRVSLQMKFIKGQDKNNQDLLFYGDIGIEVLTDNASLVMHYFDVSNYSSVYSFSRIFEKRYRIPYEHSAMFDYGHIQCMAAYASSNEVSLKAFYLFEKLCTKLGVTTVIYSGIYAEDVKKLQSEAIQHKSIILDNYGMYFPPDRTDRKVKIKAMSERDKLNQFRKFMCKWHQIQTEAFKEKSRKIIEGHKL